MDFKDHTGFEEVCAASYGLDFAALKYLLYEVGVPATVVNSHRVTPLHCLAAVYTMSEATSKSLLFSMLKDEDSWLSPMIGDAMPKYAKSVRSMDIMETLDPATAEVFFSDSMDMLKYMFLIENICSITVRKIY